MRRWAAAWPGALKARAARYALERSLGPFLEERLRLEQLSLDLRRGTGQLTALRLRAAAVDAELARTLVPLELLEGCVAAVAVSVPWAALGSEPCSLHVSGLRLALRPRQPGAAGSDPPPDVTPETTGEPPPEPPPLEGLEALALTIDTVLRQLRVTLEDAVLRLEQLPEGGRAGAALEIRMERLQYEDEGGAGAGPPPVLRKRLRVGSVRLYCQELPHCAPPGPLVQVGFSPGPSDLALRLKQNAALPGPKVELEGTVGALHLLLPPPLLGVLRGLLGALGAHEPDPPRGGQSRPMGPRDLELIERELSRQLREPPPKGPRPGDEEMFYSMTGSIGGDSAAPPGENRPPSPGGSPQHRPPPSHSSAPPGRGPPWRGGARVRLTLGTMTAALPHEGPPPPPPPAMAQRFFAHIGLGGGEGSGAPPPPDWQRALPHPHLRLCAGGAQAHVEVGAAGGAQGTLAVARMEVLEALPGAEPERLQVLHFPEAEPGSTPPRPCLHLRFGPAPPDQGDAPGAELSLELRALRSELDLGLLERLGPALTRLRGHAHRQESPTNAASRLHFRWAAPGAELCLWLPQLDLRPPPARRPWYRPAMRAERLRLPMGGVRGSAGRGGGRLQCETLSALYEAPDLGSVQWLRAAGTGTGMGAEPSLITLEVTFPPPPPSGGPRVPPPTPFSSQRSIYESHELVLPGSPEEMGGFVGGALGGSLCAFQLTLPSAHLRLSPPQLLQRLYNRLNNDLLLWEPAGPPEEPPQGGGHAPSEGHAPPDGHAPSESHAHPGSHAPSGGDTFKPCTGGGAGAADDDDDDGGAAADGAADEDDDDDGGADDEGDDDDEGADEGPALPSRRPRPQSAVAVLVCVQRGRISACCRAADADGRPLAGQHGELLLELWGGRLCVLGQQGGRSGRSCAGIEAERLALFHAGSVPDDVGLGRLELPIGPPPPHLHPTVLPWDDPKPPHPKTTRMLGAAVRGVLRGDVKELVVSVALEGATLRHRPDPPEQRWYRQLLELLCLEDEPILGYSPPTPLTELHLHLCRCAADYRPPPLPLRVLVTAETVSISSNVVSDTAVFVLRLLVDDGALFLTERCDGAGLELQRDFVCVVDVDFMELQISAWKGGGGQRAPQPPEDLRAAPLRLRARTCPDSAAAIVRLLRHLGAAGPTAGPTASHGHPRPPPPPPSAPTAAVNQRDLTDALQDPPRPHSAPQPPEAAAAPPVSVYLFPGEGGAGGGGRPITTPPGPPPPPPPPPPDPNPDPDGFCILDAPPGSEEALPPPTIRWLRPGPLILREGHFAAPRGGAGGGAGSADWLRAPPRLPPPCSRLLLRDASLQWQLYGGRDFGPGPAPKPRSRGGSAPPEGHWRTRGGPGRRTDLLMELSLGKVCVQHESYEVPSDEGGSGGVPGEHPVGRLVVLVHEMELRDRLAGGGGESFLKGLPGGHGAPRPMLAVKALRVLPHPPPPGGVPECCLRVSMRPLRLHIDQDALIFLRDFASSFLTHLTPPGPPHGDPMAPPGPSPPMEEEPEDPPIYFREFRFVSEVPVRLDYRGKRVSMEQGALAGILIGLARLNCSELRLKRLSQRHGLLGLGRVLSFALSAWLSDIRRHQLPALLGGVAPVRAVLRLWRALRELLLLPLTPLLEAGGVRGGARCGVSAFGASSAAAAVGLGARLLRALQALAEALYELVAPPGPPRPLHALPASPQQAPPKATPRRGPHPPHTRRGQRGAAAPPRLPMGPS